MLNQNLIAKEKTRAFKLVSIDYKGNKKSLCYSYLQDYKLALIYKTEKETPKNKICFVFNSLEDCKTQYKYLVLDSIDTKYNSNTELWEVEGYLVTFNGWYERLKQKSDEMSLWFRPADFMTQVRLIKQITSENIKEYQNV